MFVIRNVLKPVYVSGLKYRIAFSVNLTTVSSFGVSATFSTLLALQWVVLIIRRYFAYLCFPAADRIVRRNFRDVHDQELNVNRWSLRQTSLCGKLSPTQLFSFPLRHRNWCFTLSNCFKTFQIFEGSPAWITMNILKRCCGSIIVRNRFIQRIVVEVIVGINLTNITFMTLSRWHLYPKATSSILHSSRYCWFGS